MDEEGLPPPPCYEDALSDPTIISHSEQPRPSAPSAPSQAPEPALPTDSRTRSAFLIHPPQNDAFTLPQSNRASSSGLKARPTAATSAYPPRRSLSTVPPAGTFEDFQSQADEAVLNFDEDIDDQENAGESTNTRLTGEQKLQFIMKVYNILIAQFFFSAIINYSAYVIIRGTTKSDDYGYQRPALGFAWVGWSVFFWLATILALAVTTNRRRMFKFWSGILSLLFFAGIENFALICMSANNTYDFSDNLSLDMIGVSLSFPVPFWFMLFLFVDVLVHGLFRARLASCSCKVMSIHLVSMVLCFFVTVVVGHPGHGLFTVLLATASVVYLNWMTRLALRGFGKNEWIPGPKDVAFVALNVQIGVPILYMKLCRNQLDDQPTHSTTDEQTRS